MTSSSDASIRPEASSAPSAVPVMRTIDLRGQDMTWSQLRAAVPRQSAQSLDQAEQAVRGIINAVQQRGADAVREYAATFDRVTQERIRVEPCAVQEAVDGLDPAVRYALEETIARCRTFAVAQRPPDVDIQVAPGARLVHRWTPVARVGLYVPGGLAVYPSSVVMNVVPAQAAGVDSVVLCTPPQAEFNGLPHPTILAAAGLLGVDEIWAIGGAQALAAMAYGLIDTDHNDVLEPVQILTGPGNVFVATAKRLLRSMVGVDAEAGTTEIAVIADHSAVPQYVAADLISQAEHDPGAGVVLITHDPGVAERVAAAIATAAPRARHAARVKTAMEGPQSGVVLTDNLDASIRVADAYAAEHLEIHTENPRLVAARIRNAGAIFVGPYSPVALGDYAAGSNHVLPTGGSAVYAQGLSTTSFMKAVQVIEYSQDALGVLERSIVALAQAEDLPSHGDAVVIRSKGSATGEES